MTRSPEHIAKLRAARLGKKASAESRARMSAAKTGHKHSEETKAKMSVSIIKALDKSNPDRLRIRKLPGHMRNFVQKLYRSGINGQALRKAPEGMET